MRWNESRSHSSLLQGQQQTLRTFDSELQAKLNDLSQSVLGMDIFPGYRPPAKYTGELLGVQYLYHQTGQLLLLEGDEAEKEIDEGFGDVEECTPESQLPESECQEDLGTFSLPTEEDENESDEQVILSIHTQYSPSLIILLIQDDLEVDGTDVAVDYVGIPGWNKVDALAEALVELRGLSVTSTEIDKIKCLYDNLSDYDKAPLTYEARQRKAMPGRFARSKGNRSGHVAQEAVKR